MMNMDRIWFEKEIDISHDSISGKGRNCLLSLMLLCGGIVFRNNSRYLVILREVVFFSYSFECGIGSCWSPVNTEDVGEQPK
jgi:hypothetical protein